MLRLVTFGVFLLVVKSQLLYESSSANNTLLLHGKETDLNNLLHRCEKRLKGEGKKSSDLLRKEKDLNKKLKTLTLAIEVLQNQYQVAEPDVVEICKIQPTLIFHHPLYCQLYYNCSLPLDNGLKDANCNPRLYLTECFYPYLFSKETLRCENYTNVRCGNRFEIKWPCDYERNGAFCDFALGPHLAPYCSEYTPKCIGYPDGFFESEYRGGDPYYKICLNGRVIESGRCPFNDTWGTDTFIYKRRCTSVYEIPANEHQYGQLPSCVGKRDGSYQYPHENHKCDAYFTCKNGTAQAIKCPGTQLFDVNTGFCREGAICS